MKKTAIILGAALFLFTASINAQNENQPKEPAKVETVAATTTADRWNNWSADKYKMLPMPAALTTEKIFPVIGHYAVTNNDVVTTTENTSSFNVTVSLDESNRGIAWVEGFPVGKFKVYLKKSPGTYMIPVQKTADEKDIAGGVLIYDKENNKLDVCIGCTYNTEDPAAAFAAPAEPVVEEQAVVKTTKNKKSIKAKKAKPVAKTTWKYSGSKVVETTTASVSTMQ